MINRFIILLIDFFSKLKSMFSSKSRLLKLPYDYRYLTLPIQGLIIGLSLFSWYFIAHKVDSSALLFSVIVFTIPIILTRNIYIDNFLHTLYAVFSSPISSSNDHRLQKLIEAKTDYSRAGTVCGVIYTFLYLFLFLEFYKSEITPLILILTPIISRVIGLLLIVTVKPDKQYIKYTSSYISLSKYSINRLILIFVTYIFLLSISIYIFYGFISMIIIYIFIAIIYFIFKIFNKKLFRGVTDDTLGFCILSIEPLIFSIFMLLFIVN